MRFLSTKIILQIILKIGSIYRGGQKEKRAAGFEPVAR